VSPSEKQRASVLVILYDGLFGQAIFLSAAAWFIGNGHFNQPVFQEIRKNSAFQLPMENNIQNVTPSRHVSASIVKDISGVHAKTSDILHKVSK